MVLKALPGVGAGLARRLTDHFGTEDKVLQKDKKTANVSMNGLYQKAITSEINYLKRAGKEYKEDAKVLDEAYKKLLAQCTKK